MKFMRSTFGIKVYEETIIEIHVTPEKEDHQKDARVDAMSVFSPSWIKTVFQRAKLPL